MNRIFFAMVAIAFVFASYHQLTWVPGTPPPAVMAPVETAPAIDSADPAVVAMMERLAAVEDKLAPPAAEPEKSPMDRLTGSMFDSAKASVTLAISLIGAMTLFLGLVKVAEAGGLLAILAKLIRPVMVWLFPDVPPHPQNIT